ncbi:SspB-related isopeptide-forming adhesin [Streptococcus oralis]|uniref:SspB-related isopeptide-forming adhesin n=1 Tax=Streptococcus oralis TaxID=1303 RepID=UPI001F276CE3|nr:SspB-related isopeptide-forming adhesin [Streptococcus oralis]UJD02366.1 LPXTG cell wall anchor domain-containing protein [Streptococcus oralis]
MKFNNETRAFGSIRKTRQWGTCGVILGLAALGLITSPVRADERVNPNPATNAKPLQDSPTTESKNDQGSAGKSTGSVEVTVDRAKVESAVSTAKKAGLTVKETVVDGGLIANSEELAKKTAEIESSYDKQATTIVDESEKYKKEVETRKEEIKTITTENQEKQDSYDKAKAQYEKDLADATTKNAQIDKENQEKNERLKDKRERVAKENELIKQENALAKSTYEKAVKEKANKDAAIDKENAAAKKAYEEALKQWTIEKGKSEADLTKYKEQLAQYEKDSAEYKRKLAELQTQRVQGRANGVTIYGEFDESKRGSLDYYSKLTAVFDANPELEVVDGVLAANKNTTMTLDKDLQHDRLENKDFYGHSDSKGTYGGYVVTGIKQGSTFTLHNVGKTKTGKTISARFVARNNPIPEHKIAGNPSTYTRLNVWWNKVKTDTETSSVNFNPYNYFNVEWDIHYYDEKTGKPIDLGSVSFYSDLDFGQAVRHTYGDGNTGTVINPSGSSVKETTVNGKNYWMGVKSDGVYKKDDPSGLNLYKAGDPYYTDVDDYNSIPEGSVVSAGHGSVQHLTYLHYGDKPFSTYTESQSASYRKYWNDERRANGQPEDNDDEIFSSGFAFQLWGGRSVINQLEEPKPPLKPSESTKPRPLEPKYKEKDKTPLTPPTEKPLLASPKDEPDKPHVPIPSEPPTPDLKPVPNEVAPREIKVTYTRLKTTPTVEKLVKNSAGTNVNNSSVPKLSEVVWELKTKPLAANRKKTTIYELTDNLPQGYQLDLAKTVAQNSDFTITYDKAKHQLKGLLKSEGLAKVNLDLTKVFTAPVLKVYGTVTNDGATYKNNFRLNLNNEFESYSNIVKVTTPGKPNDPDNPNNNLIKPLKHNHNKDGVIIDGKTVLAGSTNYYRITLDYDQYKGIKAAPSAILKGFGAIDDYPEEAVTINKSDIRYIDSEGKEVSGISVYQYDSIESVDNDKVKAFLESSEIKPKGAFQVFLVDDPEAYFNKYIKAGKSVTIIDPMVTKEELRNTGKSFENTAYQVDFGNGYQTDTVVNNVPTVKPTKKNLNKEGVNIDGKQVLSGSVNYYKVTADYSQYKGIEVDKDRIGKGFYIVDDYPEEAVTINQDGVQVTDSKGQVVKGLRATIYESLDKAPVGVQESLKKQGFTPKGAIQVFEAENPEEFYKTYVQTGEVLTITNPMTVKKELGQTGGKYENTAYQIDFGMAYVTETVVNNVPKIEPKKDVVIDHLSKESLDGKEVKLNQTFNYKLVGSLIPKDRSEQLFEYKFSDDYDETHDDYQSVYKVFAAVDFETSDGQKFKAGDELTKFTSQVVDKAKGKVDISFDDAFLKSILETSEFQAEVYLQMTRIQSGTVENTYYHTVNGVEVVSNTVVTHTPEEPKTPEEHPQQPERSLPSTGEQASAELLLAGLAMGGAAAGLLYSKRKKKEA